MKHTFSLSATLWRYPGKSGWFFVTIPTPLTAEIKATFGHLKRGWGSLRINVTVNKTTWQTSIFPDNKTATYVLPVKQSIRKQAQLSTKQPANYTITIQE